MVFTIADDYEHNAPAANQLTTLGYFTDEDFYGSFCVETNYVEIERVIRLNGYSGGPLRVIGHFFPEHGAVYLAYDTATFDYDEAIKVLKNLK